MGGTMDGTKQQRRGDTRQRIQDVALELFAEQGYEKTSLREIAERLDVTKAALYYHFKTKEEILVSIFEDLTQPIEELIEWGREQPHTLETKQEIVRRYSEALAERGPALPLHAGEPGDGARTAASARSFKDRMLGLRDILMDPEAALTDQVRCVSAHLHAARRDVRPAATSRATPRRSARPSCEVAVDLVTQAHHGG